MRSEAEISIPLTTYPEIGLQILSKPCRCGSKGYYRFDNEQRWNCCNYYECDETLPEDYTKDINTPESESKPEASGG